jgi:poly-beta-hydroxyalkanoate depolymerase
MIPPLSGHRDILLGDLIYGALETCDVSVLQAIDPATDTLHGIQNGLVRQIRQIEMAFQAVSSRHSDPALFAACQSTAATIRALHKLGKSGPRSLILMAAPIGTTTGGGVGAALHEKGQSAFEDDLKSFLRTAPSGAPVLPGSTQLAAILSGSGGAARLLRLEGAIALAPMVGEARRSLARLRLQILTQMHATDASLIVEGIDANFFRQSPSLARTNVRNLLLIAGECDAIIPKDQVFAGAGVFNPGSTKRILIADADHFDLFCSDIARRQIGPLIGQFLLDERSQF